MLLSRRNNLLELSLFRWTARSAFNRFILSVEVDKPKSLFRITSKSSSNVFWVAIRGSPRTIYFDDSSHRMSGVEEMLSAIRPVTTGLATFFERSGLIRRWLDNSDKTFISLEGLKRALEAFPQIIENIGIIPFVYVASETTDSPPADIPAKTLPLRRKRTTKAPNEENDSGSSESASLSDSPSQMHPTKTLPLRRKITIKAPNEENDSGSSESASLSDSPSQMHPSSSISNPSKVDITPTAEQNYGDQKLQQSRGLIPDWVCPACKELNYGSKNRTSCYRCNASKLDSPQSSDWNCPACQLLNFGNKNRTNCFGCGAAKRDSPQSSDPVGYGKSQTQSKSEPLRPGWKWGDWECPNPLCRDHVYSYKIRCSKCGTSKLS